MLNCIRVVKNVEGIYIMYITYVVLVCTSSSLFSQRYTYIYTIRKRKSNRENTTNFLYTSNIYIATTVVGCWVLYARAIWITWENLWRHLTRHDHLITIINNTNVWLFCARSCYFNRHRSNCWWGVSLNDILNWVKILLLLCKFYGFLCIICIYIY